MGKYEDNLELIRATVRCEETGSVPFVPCGNAYYARVANVKICDYITDFDLACTVNLDEHEALEADATQNVIFSPYLLDTQWLSQTAIPGASSKIGDDDMWQVIEFENMQQEEYDDVLRDGWQAWQAKFIHERCNDNWNKLQPFFEANPRCYQRFYEAGLPCIADFLMITPFEYFCGGRSLMNFFADDLDEVPDKLHEVFSVVLESNLKTYRKQIEDTHATGVWIGGWRTGLLGEKQFREFVWPSFKAYYELCIDTDVIPTFHLDAKWDHLLPVFKELEPKTFVMALDGKTDARLCRKVLGPNVCILGDIPPEITALGTPEQVTVYETKLLEDLGPKGVMVATGCDIPSNAPHENVKALADVAHTFLDTHSSVGVGRVA